MSLVTFGFPVLQEAVYLGVVADRTYGVPAPDQTLWGGQG